jgi:hypothetical protein
VADIRTLPARTSEKYELVSSGPSMMSFRFPNEECLAYQLEHAGGQPATFIFSRPAPGRDVKLHYWSTLDLDETAWRQLLAEVLDQCRAGRAASLGLEVPESQSAALERVCRWGVVRQRYEQQVLLYASDWSVVSTDADAWNLTAMHAGFF